MAYDALSPAAFRGARMARRLLGTPAAAVSLVDKDRQWCKAARGLDGRRWPWGSEHDPTACVWGSRGDARLVARIEDRGVVETVIEPFVIPTGRVDVAFFTVNGWVGVGLFIGLALDPGLSSGGI